MIRRLLPSVSQGSPQMNGKQLFSIIAQSLVLLAVVWLMGCAENSVIDEISDDGEANMKDATGDTSIVGSDDEPDGSDGKTDVEDLTGEIVMHQTGGFAGVSRTTKIGEEDGSIRLVYTDQTFNQHKESLVSPEDLDQLWGILEANDAFTLSTNQKMLETVRDAFSVEITVQQAEKHNRFSVYAPDLLMQTGETRYNAIVQAIQRFAEPRIQTAEEFIIADMPINDISVQILESFPLQVHIVVNGFLRDGGTVLNEITQRREGNIIRIHITTKRPKDAICIQVIKEVTERIRIEGGFLPGRYKVVVNDVEKEFEI